MMPYQIRCVTPLLASVMQGNGSCKKGTVVTSATVGTPNAWSCAVGDTNNNDGTCTPYIYPAATATPTCDTANILVITGVMGSVRRPPQSPVQIIQLALDIFVRTVDH